MKKKPQQYKNINSKKQWNTIRNILKQKLEKLIWIPFSFSSATVRKVFRIKLLKISIKLYFVIYSRKYDVSMHKLAWLLIDKIMNLLKI